MRKYLELYLRYRDMIADGTFAPGERLPSMRFMARGGSHGINTVRQAFSLLERDGLVTIRERGGVLVRRRRDLDQPRPPEERFVFWDRAAGDRLDLVLERMGRRDQAFAFAAPGTDLLPERRLSRIFASIPAGWIAYSEPQGEEALRRRIALHYEPVNGPTHAKDILITNGATEAISLIVHTLISAGDVVVVESPTYYDYFRQLSAVDARVIEVRTAVGRGFFPWYTDRVQFWFRTMSTAIFRSAIPGRRTFRSLETSRTSF